MPRTRRSAQVILSTEGLMLREYRIRRKLSVREAAKELGLSPSYVSHVENGRTAAPRGERLLTFLRVYGPVGEKQFRQRCRDYKKKESNLDRLSKLIVKLKEEDLRAVLVTCERLLKGSAHP